MPADSSTNSLPAAIPARRTTGRPSLYRSEYDDLAFNYCLLGATNEDLARCFDVSRDTVQVWLATLDTFSDAVKRGREAADARVARSLFTRATGATAKTQKPVILKDGNGGQRIEIVEYVEAYPPDTVAGIFWLKNRRPDLWRDKQDVDLSVTGRIARIPDDERTAKALELLKRLAGDSTPGVQAGPVIDVEPEPTKQSE